MESHVQGIRARGGAGREDARDTQRKRYDKKNKRDRGAGAGGAAARGGGGDAEVRAFRKQLVEMQRKTTAKSAETLASNAHGNDHGKVLTDLFSKMGSSRPSSILLRTQVEETKQRARWCAVVAGEDPGRGEAAQNATEAVDAATTKRDRLQLSLQAVQDKLHEALTLRREQEAEIMELRSQVAADLPLVAATLVR